MRGQTERSSDISDAFVQCGKSERCVCPRCWYLSKWIVRSDREHPVCHYPLSLSAVTVVAQESRLGSVLATARLNFRFTISSQSLTS